MPEFRKPEHLYPPGAAQEKTSVITVRLPRSVHLALVALSHDHRNSMNCEMCAMVRAHLEAAGRWPYAADEAPQPATSVA